jgi:hypothetical protein
MTDRSARVLTPNIVEITRHANKAEKQVYKYKRERPLLEGRQERGFWSLSPSLMLQEFDQLSCKCTRLELLSNLVNHL